MVKKKVVSPLDSMKKRRSKKVIELPCILPFQTAMSTHNFTPTPFHHARKKNNTPAYVKEERRKQKHRTYPHFQHTRPSPARTLASLPHPSAQSPSPPLLLSKTLRPAQRRYTAPAQATHPPDRRPTTHESTTPSHPSLPSPKEKPDS